MFPFLAAVFLGAFLLFLVQPLMGRFVLPWQGGAPAVWTACLLFFQTALLLGYLYAHLLGRRLSLSRQSAVHTALLLGALWWIPPLPTFAAGGDPGGDPPVLAVVVMLLQTIGPPFVLLAGSSPLLQRWFAHAQPGRSPYRLYALSNAGSLLALLAYPLLVEPWFTRQVQAIGWSLLYVGFVATCAWVSWKLVGPRPHVARGTPSDELSTADAAPAPTWRNHLAWMAWAGLATALLTATTNALTLDVAAVPFLWILPLAIYLGSLILAFDHPRWYRRSFFVFLLPFAMAASLDLRIFGSTLELEQLVVTHLLALGVAGMICHGELHRARPSARFLTGFYLCLAGGGALGTLGTAVVSPLVFDRDHDLPILWTALTALVAAQLIRTRDLPRVRTWSGGLLFALIAVPVLRPADETGLLSLVHTWVELARNTAGVLVPVLLLLGIIHLRPPAGLVGDWNRRSSIGLLALVGVIAWFVVGSSLQSPPGLVASRRGFFGEVTVIDYTAADPRSHSRYLAHGNTTHGIELLHPDWRDYPTSYYSAQSGIGRAFTRANQRAGRRIGVVGLGVGTIAAYGMAGDHLTFYEIDRHIIELATTHFHFLADSAAAIDIRLGDGRRLIEAEAALGADAPPRYDMLVLDAFSSDSVPIHLLTREAFAAYLQRLGPHGVLVINVSNRLVDLRPVLEGHARHFGLHLAHLINRPDAENWWDFSSEWILLAPQRAALDTATITEWTGIAAPAELEGIDWTDEFASLWSVLR